MPANLIGEEGYKVPVGLTFMFCHRCGDEWLTAGQIEELNDAFETQRKHRLTMLIRQTSPRSSAD